MGRRGAACNFLQRFQFNDKKIFLFRKSKLKMQNLGRTEERNFFVSPSANDWKLRLTAPQGGGQDESQQWTFRYLSRLSRCRWKLMLPHGFFGFVFCKRKGGDESEYLGFKENEEQFKDQFSGEDVEESLTSWSTQEFRSSTCFKHFSSLFLLRARQFRNAVISFIQAFCWAPPPNFLGFMYKLPDFRPILSSWTS